MLLYEFDEFGTDFSLDGLAEWRLVVGEFSSFVCYGLVLVCIEGCNYNWRCLRRFGKCFLCC